MNLRQTCAQLDCHNLQHLRMSVSLGFQYLSGALQAAHQSLDFYSGQMRCLSDVDKLRSEQCPVCLTSMDDLASLVMLPCAHIYHRDCVRLALQSSPHCPCCRAHAPAKSMSSVLLQASFDCVSWGRFDDNDPERFHPRMQIKVPDTCSKVPIKGFIKELYRFNIRVQINVPDHKFQKTEAISNNPILNPNSCVTTKGSTPATIARLIGTDRRFQCTFKPSASPSLEPFTWNYLLGTEALPKSLT